LSLFHKITVYFFLLAAVSLLCGAQDTIPVRTEKIKKYQLTPIRATMYAAAFPGLGQIYNRKYWKLPFVYGGFGALGYAVVFNSSSYNKSIEAYQDFSDDDPNTNSYTTLPWLSSYDPSEYDPDTNPGTYSWVKTNLQNSVDYFRRYRDLSYIGIAAWYLVTIIDANVDASLFDYDISDDLKASITPLTVTRFGVYPGVTVAFVKTF